MSTQMHAHRSQYTPTGEKRAGTWYNARFLNDMESLYPNIRHLDQIFGKPRAHYQLTRNCRVAVVEALPGNQSTLPMKPLSYNELHGYLSQPTYNECPNRGRVFILENLNSFFIELFGSHFGLDPFIFASQARSTNWEADPDGPGNTPKLLVSEDSITSFSLRYCELRVFSKLDPNVRSLIEMNAGRQIQLTRSARRGGKLDNVGIIRQLASFWSRTYPNGAWDGIHAMSC